ncbi:hypothetical protein [Paenibacillus aestuarii]|uniref:Uncharacterized protein n=1 Tax=Paenibacillus aestuarii TaxID=516965 RepID=A0ABW0K9X3_9BACL|nr:hypothetical protein [Paenibacillus aestuarii]
MSLICAFTEDEAAGDGLDAVLPVVVAGLEVAAGLLDVVLGAADGLGEAVGLGATLGDALAVGAAALAVGFSFAEHAVNISTLATSMG